jgi:hypothetical protein
MIFSVYELWQASGQMFIYVDDGRDVPTWLHVTKDFGLIGLAVGVLGPVVISLRWANSKIRLSAALVLVAAHPIISQSH